MPHRVYFGNTLTVRCSLSNHGIAPIYYNWPTYFYLFNENAEIVVAVQAEIDLRQVLPGTPSRFQIRLPLEDLENGTYSVGMAILDPLTKRPAIRFANENPRKDLIQELGSFKLQRVLPRN
jgi:hypothetical protein